MIISFTHKNTDIETREKLAFGNELEKSSFLKEILDCAYINEAILLSTCNRVEVITNVKSVDEASDSIFKALGTHSKLDKDELVGRADIFDDHGAIHHLFMVASSLDSLVVGETQITGQLKDAFTFSISHGYCSQKLSRVMHYSFKCAAAVRRYTSIGENSVSVASTAVMKAKSILPDTNNYKAIVVGAGQMSELAVKHLIKAGFKVVLVSRNMKKAQLLATTFEHEVEVKPYEALQRKINKYQLVFTATSAPYPIIKEDMVEEVDFQRYWFDIAVPRDIEDIKRKGLNIYTVDDLQDIVEENLALRQEQAKEAYGIIGKMTSEFYAWLATLGVEPLIKTLHQNADEIIMHKLNNAIKKGYIKSEEKENIKKLCSTIVTELLHKPSKRLREVSMTAESDVMVGTVQSLFGMKKDIKMLNKYKCEHALEHSIS